MSADAGAPVVLMWRRCGPRETQRRPPHVDQLWAAVVTQSGPPRAGSTLLGSSTSTAAESWDGDETRPMPIWSSTPLMMAFNGDVRTKS